MTFQFEEGAAVALRANNAALGLSAGDTGVVWALYETEPPSYEVTFRSADGQEFDSVVGEGELTEPVSDPATYSLHPNRSQAAA